MLDVRHYSMNEFVTEYGELVSFLASFFGVAGIVVGLFLYWKNKKGKLAENEHRLVLKKQFFDNNTLKYLVKFEFCTKRDSITIEELKEIHDDSAQLKKLLENHDGIYCELCEIVSLSREVNQGKIESKVSFFFFIFVIVCIVAAACMYRPNKAGGTTRLAPLNIDNSLTYAHR